MHLLIGFCAVQLLEGEGTEALEHRCTLTFSHFVLSSNTITEIKHERSVRARSLARWLFTTNN